MASIYQKAASYLTKKNAGKKRVPIGQVREILKDLVNQTVELGKTETNAVLAKESFIIQLAQKADEIIWKKTKKKKK